MGFIEKAKQIVTGKSDIERRQEAAANRIIRQKVYAAQLKQREIEAVKFAQAREKAIYEKRTKQLTQPKPNMFGGMGSPFGQPRFAQPPVQVVKRVKRKVKRPKSRTRTVVKYINKTPRAQPPQRYDVIGGGW